MRVVVSLGGSLIFQRTPNTEYLKKFSMLVNTVDAKFGIVVGGGSIGKTYVEAAREFGENQFDLDLLGIITTQANAGLVKAALKAQQADSILKAAHLIDAYKTVVISGTHPGHTTDAVAALLAEKTDADRWVNLSNVDGVYDHDPREFKDARKFGRMTHKQLTGLAIQYDQRHARENFIVDTLAAKILARSNIEAHFVNGMNLVDVKAAFLGKKHNGTLVKD